MVTGFLFFGEVELMSVNVDGNLGMYKRFVGFLSLDESADLGGRDGHQRCLSQRSHVGSQGFEGMSLSGVNEYRFGKELRVSVEK